MSYNGRLLALACELLGAASLFMGCGKGADAGKPARAWQPSGPSVQWEPTPIELPKVVDTPPTPADQMKAVAAARWAGEGSAVIRVRFDLTGERAVVALENGTIHVLDAKTGESLGHWQSENQAKLTALEVTIDTKRALLRYDGDERLYVCKLDDGELIRTIEPSDAKTTAFALAADPRLVAVGDESGRLRVWNIDTGDLLEEATVAGAPVRITALAFSNDCKQLFVAHRKSGKIAVHNLPGLDAGESIEQNSMVPVRLLPDWSGHFLVALCDDRAAELIVLDPPQGWTARTNHRAGAAPMTHGELDNWFAPRNSHGVCCYLGDDAFEYRGLPSGESAGGFKIDAEPLGRVDLSADGTTAATGYANGSVQFYKLPGPGATATRKNRTSGSALLQLLLQEKYDELELQATEKLNTTSQDSTRTAPAQIALAWLRPPDGSSAEACRSRIAMLEKWLEAKPNSRAARIALADAICHYAWVLRGGDTANKTTEEQFRGFHEQLTKADEILMAAEALGDASAPLCAVAIPVMMGLGRSKQEIVKTWQRGVDVEPLFARTHLGTAYALLPRWCGAPGDAALLADRALDTLGGETGLIVYGMIAEEFATFEPASSLLAAGFRSDKLEESARAMIKKYPECNPAWNFAAVVACLRQDHNAASERITQMAGTFTPRMWRQKGILDRFRIWSRGKEIESDAAFRALASWFGLRQVLFVGDGAELLTLGVDPQQQVHSWNVEQRISKHVLPLPSIAPPIYMDAKARYVVCSFGIPKMPLTVLDLATGKTLSWRAPGDLFSLTDEGHYFATYGIGQSIKVFDLEQPSDEAVQELAIRDELSDIEFPSQQEPFRIVIAEKTGALRTLSDKATDLAPPARFSRPCTRIRAIPGSSRVLACGSGLLVVYDSETGECTRLCDDDDSASRQAFFYSALAASSDGRLAAAARRHYHPAEVEQPYDIEVWDIAGAKKLHTFCGHEAQIISLSISADGSRLASGDELGFIQVWDLAPISKRLRNFAATDKASGPKRQFATNNSSPWTH